MKPATPLPWSQQGDHVVSYGHRLVGAIADSTQSVYKPLRIGSDHWDAGMTDAAYIVHACNAYPRLVEALRGIFDADTRADMSLRQKQDARKAAGELLRELGE